MQSLESELSETRDKLQAERSLLCALTEQSGMWTEKVSA